jgi:hypothetical protein
VFYCTGPQKLRQPINRQPIKMLNLLPLQSLFYFFFGQVFLIILNETNGYFDQYMSSKNTGSNSPQPSDIMMTEMYIYFGLQMGNDQRHILKDYWSREEQHCTLFCSNTQPLLPHSSISSFL